MQHRAHNRVVPADVIRVMIERGRRCRHGEQREERTTTLWPKGGKKPTNLSLAPATRVRLKEKKKWRVDEWISYYVINIRIYYLIFIRKLVSVY